MGAPHALWVYELCVCKLRSHMHATAHSHLSTVFSSAPAATPFFFSVSAFLYWPWLPALPCCSPAAVLARFTASAVCLARAFLMARMSCKSSQHIASPLDIVFCFAVQAIQCTNFNQSCLRLDISQFQMCRSICRRLPC